MKQKAVLIKDFYNDKGALHVGDKVVIQPGTIKQNSNDFNQNDINYSSSYGILG